MSDRLCIDLCSGLGGFSQAFVDAGWEVVTVDIEPKFNPTTCADLCEIAEHPSRFPGFYVLKPEVVLASPPCERLSQAAHVWPLPGIGKALRVVGACLEIITALKPTYWGLENPALGKLHWFIGEPAKRIRINAYGYRTVKPTAIWGNLPLPLSPVDSPHVNREKNAFANYDNGKATRAALRAKMPLGLSQAILDAVSPAKPVVERKEEGPQ